MATVLVVDDAPISRDFLRTLLGYRGHEACEAADGDTALRLARSRPPDAVITDVLMPNVDGYELARLLRLRPETRHIPIVFSTAHYGQQDIVPLARACGVRDVIFKPAQPARVLAAIDALLGASPTVVAPVVRVDDDLTAQWQRHAAFFADRLAETHRLTRSGTWDLDPATGVIVLSAGLRDLLRLPTAGVRPDQLRQRVHPEDLTKLAAMAANTWRTGLPDSTEIRVADLDGVVHELIVSCRTRRLGGQVRAVWGAVQDVTHVRDAQRTHLRSQAEWHADRRVVESFHRAVLPRELPTVAGADLGAIYLAAPEQQDVGAGWYDARLLGGDRILLSIGKVAGHDRPAAAAMAPALAVLRACALDDPDPDPARLLTRLNGLLAGILPGDTYVTAAVAVFDPASRRLHLANAGQPAPVVLAPHGDGLAVSVLPRRGPALGILPDASFPAQSLRLAPGAVLCAYTNGLRDARRVPRVALRVRREAAGAEAQDLAERILGEVLGGEPPDDDVCLAVLRSS